MLFDAHTHLQQIPEFLPGMEAELQRIGLRAALVNGTREADWERVEALAKRHRWVIPCYGLHPWFLAERTRDWLEHLTERLVAKLEKEASCLAGIGEIGLDRGRVPGKGNNGNRVDWETQKTVFREQLLLAARLNCLANIHCVRAWGALEEILKVVPVPECGFLLHAYSGSVEMTRGFIQRGAYFSFSSRFHRNRKAEELFRALPAERLLVETDAPGDTSSVGAGGEVGDTDDAESRAYPAQLQTAYRDLAAVRGWSLEETVAVVAENATRFFRIESLKKA